MKKLSILTIAIPLLGLAFLLTFLTGHAYFPHTPQAILDFTIQPTALAAVPGQPATAQLTVASDTAVTIQFSLTNIPSGWNVPTPSNVTLQPNTPQTINLAITPNGAGTTAVIPVTAQIAGSSGTAVTQPLAVQIVDDLVTITQVTLSPNFVETGSGNSAVSIKLINHTGLPLNTTANVRLLNSNAQIQDQFNTPLIIQPRPTEAILGNINLNGLATGVYQLLVTLSGNNGLTASNFAPLAIGQGLKFSHTPNPISITPLATNIVATTAITTERLHIPTNTVTFNPITKWSANFFQEFAYDQVAMAPAVGDITGDSIPDIVFSSYNGTNYSSEGILRAYQGDNGDEIFSVTDSTLRVNPLASLVLIDLENDGTPEIVAMRSVGGLIAFDNSGQLKYTSIPTFTLAPQEGIMPVAADLDQDGLPEIIVGRHVLNNTLSQVTELGDASGDEDLLVGSVVADVNLDGVPEVIANNTIYAGSGGILHQNSDLPGLGSVGVGNFDSDLYPEIVLVDPLNNGRIYLLDHQMNLIWGPVAIPSGGTIQFGNGGPPTIADFDGDGWPEIGVAGDKNYVVFEGDGSILWQKPTTDISSGFTGSSVFDFQGDGRSEVVYADEDNLYIFDGTDGTILYQTGHASITGYEMPIIADVDADGAAEIVLVDNDAFWGDFTGLRVLEADDNSWVSTRQIWHQHAYDITSIDDNLQIVSHPTPVWLLHNNFRSQAPTPTQGNAYFIDLVHHLSATDTALITDTLAPPPLFYDDSQIHWLYPQQDRVQLKVGQLSQQIDPALGWGAVRALSTHTAVTYTISGGTANNITLPPFYVVTPHSVNLSPATTAVTVGNNAQFSISLHNTSNVQQTFALSLYGVPTDWATYNSAVTVSAGDTAERTLTINVPLDAAANNYTLLLKAEAGGSSDAVSVLLTVTAPKPLTAVTINGATAGLINQAYTFTAQASPHDASQPITYTWQADDQTPITHVGALSDAVNFTWTVTGTKAITLTAENGENSVTAVYTLPLTDQPEPPQNVTLTGPLEGFVNQSYTFTATIAPLTTTQPLTYTWQTDGLAPVVTTGLWQHNQSFTWTLTGTKTITVTATNGAGTAVASHQITLDINDQTIYLPLVMRPDDTPPPPPTDPTCLLTPYQPANPAGIDLVITALQVTPNPATPGQLTTVQVTIKNQGQQAVSAGNNFYVDFYVNPSPEPPNPTQPGVYTWAVQGVDMGAGASRTLTITDYSFLAGKHHLWAQVDTDNTVPPPGSGNEANENNNTYGCYSLIVQ